VTAEATAAAWYARQTAIAAATAKRLTELWARIRADQLDASYRAILAQLLRLLSTGQLSAAIGVDGYVDRILREQDITPHPEGAITPAAFAGRTADGRPNAQLLARPLIGAKLQIQAGRNPDQAIEIAGRALARLSATEIADTGRSAVTTAIAARPEATAWVRRARGATTCDRCLVLTSRVYPWQADFSRHPRCDCIAIPSTDAAGERFTRDTNARPDEAGMASVAELSARSRGAKAPDELVTTAPTRAAAVEALQRAGYLT
jgi:hypothetical protein